MRWLLFAVFALAGARLMANPLAWDPHSNPLEMTAENVAISVGAKASRVAGVYRFRLGPPPDPAEKPRHATLYVPVFLPNVQDGTAIYEHEHGTPVVRIGARRLAVKPWQDLTPVDAPASPELPRGWYMALYHCRVPLQLAQGEFEVNITYAQPHLPGGVAAYAPLHPPRAPGAGLIAFTAEGGGKVRFASGLRSLAAPREKLEVVPRHRELIRVRAADRAK